MRLGAELGPGRVVDRTRGLRHMGAAVPTAEITWSEDELELRHAPDNVDSLAAVRSTVRNEPVHVSIQTQGTSPMWVVDFPFTAQQERDIRGRPSGLPADVHSSTVRGGRMERLSVGVRDPKIADAVLRAAILNIQANRVPVYLKWNWLGTNAAAAPKFAGAVHVGGRQYPPTAGERNPQRYYSPDAVAVQRAD